MKRHLDFSNAAPVPTMGPVLEPQRETMREGGARDRLPRKIAVEDVPFLYGSIAERMKPCPARNSCNWVAGMAFQRCPIATARAAGPAK